MEPQSFARFLRSPAAIQLHLLFGILLVILAVAMFTGDASQGAQVGIVFVVTYPILLALRWWRHNDEIKSAVRDAVERTERPAEFRLKREVHRILDLTSILVVSIILLIGGYRGWMVGSIPAHFLGYVGLAFIAAGLAGINIWSGSPNDPRDDPDPRTIDDDVT